MWLETGLKGKLVMVTGAAKGIGRAILTSLAREGASLVLHYYQSKEDAEALGETLLRDGREVLLVQGDLADLDAVRRIRDEIRAHFSDTPLFGIVNNAGWGQHKRFLDYRPGEWRRQIDVCFYGLVHLAYVFLPDMVKQQRGKWINIVGDSSRVGDPQLAILAAARAAAINLFKSLALEHGKNNVQFNTISLGLVDQGYLGMDQETIDKIALRYPLRRIGRPEDIPGAVLYFLSDQAGWVTGQVLPVNGGFSMLG